MAEVYIIAHIIIWICVIVYNIFIIFLEGNDREHVYYLTIGIMMFIMGLIALGLGKLGT
jgi:hypothetical protein